MAKALAVDASLDLIDGDGFVAAGGDVAARGGAVVGLPHGLPSRPSVIEPVSQRNRHDGERGAGDQVDDVVEAAVHRRDDQSGRDRKEPPKTSPDDRNSPYEAAQRKEQRNGFFDDFKKRFFLQFPCDWPQPVLGPKPIYPKIRIHVNSQLAS